MINPLITTRQPDHSTITPEMPPAAAPIRPVDFSISSGVVIRVENLWKEYRLGAISHKTLTKDLQSWWARMRGKEDPNLRIDQTNQRNKHSTSARNSTCEALDRFWALRDVSFDVKQGEVLGIIGKNGAGKSTLLKILSRVTTPTQGEIKVKGRVASLLEVGTGFHPELTGRENIFLNGAILGMSKEEIRRKFDEIVAFAEIEKFIDTPVKRYSSGMYVRLAFAVAAHLEPEILVVDEVLAVGDAQFQKKCLGKMEEVGKEGRTVLFVSHNIKAVERLCHSGILLENGLTVFAGHIDDALSKYINKDDVKCKEDLSNVGVRTGNGLVKFKSIRIVECERSDKQIYVGESIKFSICLEKKSSDCIKRISIAIGIDNKANERIITLWSKYIGRYYEMINSEMVATCIMRNVVFKSGTYKVHLYADIDGCVSDYLHEVTSFDLLYDKYYEGGIEPTGGQGDLMLKNVWE